MFQQNIVQIAAENCKIKLAIIAKVWYNREIEHERKIYMRRFNCECFGKDAVCNEDFGGKVTIFREHEDNSKGFDYKFDVVICPRCGEPTTVYEEEE